MGIQAPAEVNFALLHEVIKQNDNELSISSLCGITDVFRFGYYIWIKEEPVRQSRDDVDKTVHLITIPRWRFGNSADL